VVLSGFGSGPTISDIVNKWILRRISRKCAEGTEEGRKDMEAFCIDVMKRLRRQSVVPAKTVLYRAVPQSKMGSFPPSVTEFEQDFCTVWPTFASMTKSREKADEILNNNGGVGFLFIVETQQARDVSKLAPVAQDGGEFMLEPGSRFTITDNKQEGKVFIVKMESMPPDPKKLFLSEDVEDTKESKESKHHHSHAPKETASAPQSPAKRTESSGTIVTPVMRRMPTIGSVPASPRSGLRKEQNISSLRTSPHRTQRSTLQTMTMWVASQANVRVLSTRKRPAVKSFTPDWVHPKEKEPEEKADVEDNKEKSEVAAAAAAVAAAAAAAASSTATTTSTKPTVIVKPQDTDSSPSPPISPSSPGFGTLVLYPTLAPDYIIDDSSVDFETLGGFVIQSIIRSNQRRVMSLKATS